MARRETMTSLSVYLRALIICICVAIVIEGILVAFQGDNNIRPDQALGTIFILLIAGGVPVMFFIWWCDTYVYPKLDDDECDDECEEEDTEEDDRIEKWI